MASSGGKGVTKTNLGGKRLAAEFKRARPEEKGAGLGSMPLTLFLLVAAVAVYLRVSTAHPASPAGLSGGSTGILPVTPIAPTVQIHAAPPYQPVDTSAESFAWPGPAADAFRRSGRGPHGHLTPEEIRQGSF